MINSAINKNIKSNQNGDKIKISVKYKLINYTSIQTSWLPRNTNKDFVGGHLP